MIFPSLKHVLDWRGQKRPSCEVAVDQWLPRVRDPDVALKHARLIQELLRGLRKEVNQDKFSPTFRDIRGNITRLRLQTIQYSLAVGDGGVAADGLYEGGRVERGRCTRAECGGRGIHNWRCVLGDGVCSWSTRKPYAILTC